MPLTITIIGFLSNIIAYIDNSHVIILGLSSSSIFINSNSQLFIILRYYSIIIRLLVSLQTTNDNN